MMNDCLKIRVGIIFVVFFLILVSTTVPLAADTVAEIRLEAEMGQEENVLTVNVNLAENPGIAGLIFHFLYDEEILKVISVTDNIFPSPLVNDLEKGYIGYSFAETKDYKETGVILSVEFEILDSVRLPDCVLGFDKLDACNADLETVLLKGTRETVQKLLKEGSSGSSGEKGKWVLPAICILISIVAAGGIGWFIYRKRQK